MSSNDSSFVSYTTLAVLAAGLAGGYAINKMVSPSPSTAAPPHSAKGPTASTSSLSPPSSSAAASSGLSKKKKKAPSPSTSPAAVVQPLLDQATAAKDQLVAVTSTAVKQAQANPAVQRAVQGAKEVVESAVETVQQAATTAAGGAATTASKKKKKGKKGTTTPPAPAAAAEAEAAKTAPSFKAAVAPVNSDGESKTAAAKTLKLVGGKVGADPSSLLKVPGQGQQEEESGSGWESAASIDNEDEGSWDTVKTKKPSRPVSPSGLVGSTSASAGRTIPGLPQEALTKKQRENQKKKEKELAIKGQQDNEQEERLRAYRKEQEKAKIAADNLARSRARPRSQNFFGSEPQAPVPKVLGGGMSAQLDPTSGSLVWD